MAQDVFPKHEAEWRVVAVKSNPGWGWRRTRAEGAPWNPMKTKEGKHVETQATSAARWSPLQSSSLLWVTLSGSSSPSSSSGCSFYQPNASRWVSQPP
jgi:hypothetical protein